MSMSDKKLDELIASSNLVFKSAASKPIWVIAFSGGKDSSVLLDLALRFLASNENRVKHAVIVYSDTLLEPPPLREYAIRVLDSIESNVELRGINIRVLRVSPLVTNEDIVEMVIRRGYPAPSVRFRWCTDRWKIRPARVVFKRIFENPGRDKIAVFTGIRAEEAAHRSRRIAMGYVYSKRVSDTFGGMPFAPLYAWRASNVWAYIREFEPIWGDPSWKILEKLYAGLETVRGGCWACTLIARDRAWEALVRARLVDKELYALMTVWKRLWLHFSRVKPEYWRYIKRRRKTKKGKEWKFVYSKLREEARLALGLCLRNILLHEHYPRDVSLQLIPKLEAILEKYNKYYESLRERLESDKTALTLIKMCNIERV